MTLVRQNGMLVETEGQDTQQLAKLQGIPVTPTSPAGVAGMGATPDQAKMAGSSAQKQSVVEDATKPQDTLQTAQRTKAPVATPTAPDQAAADKAAKIQSLGSLSTRVESMINQKLAAAQPVTGQVSDTQLATLPMEKQAEAKAKIQALINNPADMQAVADATNFWVDNGWGTAQDFDPSKFIATAQESLGKQAAAGITDQVTLADVDMSDDEKTQLTDAFGDDSWQTLTPQQLSQKIETMRQAEFSRVQGLKSQLASAQGAQRQSIIDQLDQAGQSGATGTEANVADISKQVANADTVQIGGTAYKVEDLLKDDAVSDLVTRMLSDPKLSAEVAKTSPDFAKWVSDNAKGLQDLSKGVQATTGQVRTVQDQKAQLANVAGTTLSKGVMKLLVPDWDRVTATVPDTSSSGILTLLQKPGVDDTTKQAMASAIERHAADPTYVKQLNNMAPDAVQHAWDYAKQLQSDPTGLLGQLIGVTPANTDFLTDPAAQQQIEKLKPSVQALAAVASQPGMQAIMSDPELANLIKSGQFSPGDAATLAQHPEKFAQWKTYHKSYAALDEALKTGNIDQALDTIFGRDVNVDDINADYAAAKAMYDIDPTSSGGKKYAAFQANLDLNRDGKIDQGDLDLITQKGKAGLSPYGSPVQTGFADIIGLPAPTNKYQKSLADSMLGDKTVDSGKEGSLFEHLSAVLADKKITTAEMQALAQSDPAAYKKIMDNQAYYKSMAEGGALDDAANQKAVGAAQAGQVWNDTARTAFGGGGLGTYQAARDTVFHANSYLTYEQDAQVKGFRSQLSQQLAGMDHNTEAYKQLYAKWKEVDELLQWSQANYNAAEAAKKKPVVNSNMDFSGIKFNSALANVNYK